MCESAEIAPLKNMGEPPSLGFSVVYSELEENVGPKNFDQLSRLFFYK